MKYVGATLVHSYIGLSLTPTDVAMVSMPVLTIHGRKDRFSRGAASSLVFRDRKNRPDGPRIMATLRGKCIENGRFGLLKVRHSQDAFRWFPFLSRF